MANYKAVVNGNWSSLATWQDDSLGYFAASTVLPTSADNVYPNTFTVTIDTTTSVNTLTNVALGVNTTLSDVIPLMTSATTPSGIVSASSTNGNNYPYLAFDRSNGTIWGASGTNTGWLSYQFPTGKIIKKYGFYTYSNNINNIKTWTFEGSNNGLTWTTLDTQTNYVTAISTFYAFDISSNTTSYTYYRINVTAVQTLGNAIVIPNLEMAEVTALNVGITAGGTFNITTGGVTVTCASTITQAMTTTVSLLNISNTTGTVNINASIIQTTVAAAGTVVNISSLGIINWTGNLAQHSVSSGNVMVNITSAVTLNIIGDIYNNTNTGSQNPFTLNFGVASSGFIFNLTGNIYIPTLNTGGPTLASVALLSAGTVNITGNVYFVGTSSATNALYPLYITGNSIVTITGNITGGTKWNPQITIYAPATAASAIITVIGNLYGGNASNYGEGGRALVNDGTTSKTFLNGLIVCGNYGAFPLHCARFFLINNTSKYIDFASSNTNGAFYPATAPTRSLMYSPNTLSDAPVISDVRQGTVYASGSQTGTLIVPLPSNVRLGIGTDNTVGTATLNAADVWDYLTTAITTSGSVGKLIKDNLDAQVSTRATNAGVITELNTSTVDVAKRLRVTATVESTGDQIANL